MKTIYLAGGFRSGWQKKVKEEVNKTPGNWSIPESRERGYGQFLWNDPFEKERGEFAEDREWTAREYTKMDLMMIDCSDIVFAYLEKDSPGLGMTVECGYAKGKGKTVILVREKPHEVHTDRYLDFLEEMCDITFNSLEDGITFLRAIA